MNEAVFKSILHKVRGGVDGPVIGTTRDLNQPEYKIKHLKQPYGAVDNGPEATTPESLATSILAGHNPDEANRIVAVWKKLFGVSLNSEEVRNQLTALRKWQSRWMNGGSQTEGSF